LGTVKLSFELLKVKRDRAREKMLWETTLYLCSRISILPLIFQIILALLYYLLPIRIPHALGKEETVNQLKLFNTGRVWSNKTTLYSSLIGRAALKKCAQYPK